MTRFVKVVALAAALALPVSGFAQAKPAPKPGAMQNEKEEHPEIRAAMEKLREARTILEHRAGNDFEGHKKQAVESIDQALEHLRQAMNVSDKK